MTEEQRVLDAVKRWLDILRRTPGFRFRAECPTPADVDHSALLRRLLDGKEPLPAPPPTRHSYPWHELIETGAGTAWDAGEYDHYPGVLVIDQGMQWRIVERRPDGSYLVLCTANGELWDVTPAATAGRERWLLTRRGDGHAATFKQARADVDPA